MGDLGVENGKTKTTNFFGTGVVLKHRVLINVLANERKQMKSILAIDIIIYNGHKIFIVYGDVRIHSRT